MSARRYEPLLKIASGGTASVWVGAAAGALGFRQLVAIKRPHEHLADDPSFVAALVEEAKIASRLRHANAVDVRDVEADESGVQLVMDWVEGASLSDLIRAWQKERPARPHAVAIRIVLDACEGLRALHELRSDDGTPLGCVHRDVSPANVLVGLDGVGRITDFGLARPLLAVERTTSQGALRGKLGYMAPEYIRGKDIDHRVDVFAMSIVLWEALACRRLYRGENDAETLERVQREPPPKLADVVPAIGDAVTALDALLERALAKDPASRTSTIAELATELERIARSHDIVASHAEVRDSFGVTLRTSLEERRREVQRALRAAQTDEGGASASASRSQPVWRPSSAPPPTSGELNPSEHTRAETPEALRVVGASTPPSRTPPSRTPLWAGLSLLGVLVLGGGASAIAVVASRADAGTIANPDARRTSEPDIQVRADEARMRAAPSASASVGRARSAKTVHPASLVASSSTGPGTDEKDKPPRPNPYVSSGRAH